MMRYRSATVSPGRKRPSEEVRVKEGDDGRGETATVRVGVLSPLTARPQALQKWLLSARLAPQAGHFIR